MSSLISVIVPCYNQSIYLDETLQSVFNQTYQNWECIIVNDGSTDDTEKIGLKWLKKDIRFSYYFKENGGLSSSRNFGIEKSNGDYLQFLDSDDLITPEKFEKQLHDLKEAQISVCDYFPFSDLTGEYNSNRYLSPFLSDQKYKEEVISEWEYRKSIPCHTVIFSKKLVLDNDLKFSEDLENHEDWVFWAMLFYFSDTYVNNSNVYAKYRIRIGSMSDQSSMARGFLKASNILIAFFKGVNDSNLKSLTIRKKKEIQLRNKRKKYFLRKLFAVVFRFIKRLDF